MTWLRGRKFKFASPFCVLSSSRFGLTQVIGLKKSTVPCHKTALSNVLYIKDPKMDPKFEHTYRSYYPKLFRIAAKILQDPEDAKDVVQEVFTAYYFAMNNEKIIRDTKNWLLRCTVNKGIDYKRKTTRTVKMENPLPETNESSHDEVSDILNAIEHLSQKEQELVVLYSEGYSYKEIAEITERNYHSIGKTLSRILDKIKKHVL